MWIFPCAKGARYVGVVDTTATVGRALCATSDLPRAPMVDTATIVGRAFGATCGSFRAQNAHATPVWWIPPPP
ncbi:hypothetical protein [Idiomarina baltica]|uniref:Uncharacterized protein n=1 Tax=Idiomarina baltica OS145 TaxID=314276 RepID=A0ABM9WLU1_9GAMM|nr:hypothetical protein [Idiomarina baltica]EAQ31936.1 hypothetical protein OS145_11616 [Idiomarina baltica OS145]